MRARLFYALATCCSALKAYLFSTNTTSNPIKLILKACLEQTSCALVEATGEFSQSITDTLTLDPAATHVLLHGPAFTSIPSSLYSSFPFISFLILDSGEGLHKSATPSNLKQIDFSLDDIGFVAGAVAGSCSFDLQAASPVQL